MKKKHYLLGYKVMLFCLTYFFMGQASFAAVYSAEVDIKDGNFLALKTLTFKRNPVIGIFFEKDDGTLCQVSEQENPEDYIPSFLKVGDSFEDFGLPECGEEELATLVQLAQVAAIDSGSPVTLTASTGLAFAPPYLAISSTFSREISNSTTFVVYP